MMIGNARGAMRRATTRCVRLAVRVGWACVAIGAARADTLRVPGQFPTIQAAIDAAGSGDIVELADGTYRGEGNVNLDRSGRIRSASGDPARCIIDCEGAAHAFVGPHDVSGVTVTNAASYAFYLSYWDLGAVYVRNCVIIGNGGGVAVEQECAAALVACRIIDNSGNGIFCLSDSDVRLTDCILSGNRAEAGGAVYAVDPRRFDLENCTLVGNSASVEAGGIYAWGGFSDMTATNCLIADNSAPVGGNVLLDLEARILLTNCTIASTTAAPGDSILGRDIADLKVTNSIIWAGSSQPIVVDPPSVFYPIITYSNIRGGWSGQGNIDADPMFVSAEDYRLLPASPSIDAGDNRAIQITALDLDGGPRFVDDPATPDTGVGPPPVVDMGAYEACFGPDSDGDGVRDCDELCPDDPDKTDPGQCGCGVPDPDTDGDGVADCNDACPLDPDKTEPGECGCGMPDLDSDKDGIPDCLDNCPSVPNVDQSDRDDDDVGDPCDECPDDPAKSAEGTCGCGVPDTDRDSDGVPDCIDACPDDPAKSDPGVCGCGVADVDSDGDAVFDCEDDCPDDPDRMSPGDAGCGRTDPMPEPEPPVASPGCAAFPAAVVLLVLGGARLTRSHPRATRRRGCGGGAVE